MKNLILLGITALTLFSVSAGLSIYLQQTKKAATSATDGDEKAGKDTADASEKKGTKELEKPVLKAPEKKAEPKATASADPVNDEELKNRAQALQDRESRLEKQKEQVELILADIRAERDALDALSKQVAVEAKAAAALATEVDNKASEVGKIQQANTKALEDLKKQQLETEASEKKNIDRLATLSDNMPADTAAKVLQQLAESGKMDTAVKILASMKERQAARVLAELQDLSLAGQLMEKMRTLKRNAPASPSGP